MSTEELQAEVCPATDQPTLDVRYQMLCKLDDLFASLILNPEEQAVVIEFWNVFFPLFNPRSIK